MKENQPTNFIPGTPVAILLIVIGILLCPLLTLGPAFVDLFSMEQGRSMAEENARKKTDAFQANEKEKYETALALWEKQKPGSYTLRINFTEAGFLGQRNSLCQMEVKVQGKESSQSSETCPNGPTRPNPNETTIWGWPSSAPTRVEDLFHHILPLLSQSWSGPNGPACDGLYVYQVEYDPVLGYPQQIKQVILKPDLSPKPANQSYICGLAGTFASQLEYEVTLEP